MPEEIEQFIAPGKYEIDKSMEKIERLLKIPRPSYIDIVNGHKIINPYKNKNLYKRLQNK